MADRNSFHRQRILCWGAGAIGGTVAAYLTRAGHDVTLVDVNRDHVAAIRSKGLRVVGPVDEFTVEIPAFAPEDVAGSWPIVMLAVKAQATVQACRQIADHLDEDGFVVSLQNGLCEITIARELGTRRTMGALVGFMGDWLAPGEIRFGQRAKFAVGELDGAKSPRLYTLTRLLGDFEPDVEATDHIWGYLWGKLGFSALLFGTALGTSTLPELFSSRPLLPIWRGLAGEVMAVATALGIEPKGFDGFDPQAFSRDAGPGEAQRSMDEIASILEGSPKTHSGPWRDIAVHRRKTEIREQLEPVIDAGKERDVPTPMLRRLVDLVSGVEAGELKQSDALIADIMFEAPPVLGHGMPQTKPA